MATKFKVQRPVEVRTAARSIGRVWINVAKGKRQATAERLAQYARIDARHERPVATRVAPVRITP